MRYFVLDNQSRLLIYSVGQSALQVVVLQATIDLDPSLIKHGVST